MMKKVLCVFFAGWLFAGNAWAIEFLDNLNRAGELDSDVDELKIQNDSLKKRA